MSSYIELVNVDNRCGLMGGVVKFNSSAYHSHKFLQVTRAKKIGFHPYTCAYRSTYLAVVAK